MSGTQNLVCFASLAGAASVLIAGRAYAMPSGGMQFLPELLVAASCLYSVFTLQKGKAVDDESKKEMCESRMLAGLLTVAVCLAMPFLQTISEFIGGDFLVEFVVTTAVTFWLYKVRSRPIRMGAKKIVSPPSSPKPVLKCLNDPKLSDSPLSDHASPVIKETTPVSSKTSDAPKKEKVMCTNKHRASSDVSGTQEKKTEKYKPAILGKINEKSTSAQDVLKLVDILVKGKLLTNPREYTIVISALGRIGHWQTAVKLLHESVEQGLEPNVVLFTSAISACDKARQLKPALALLDEMHDYCVAPNMYTYSALISACDKAKEPLKALELLKQMKDENIEPNEYAYTAAISACGKGNGLWRHAYELMAEMRQRGVRPTVVTYNALISTLEKSSQPKKALELLKEMEAEGVSPNERSFNSLINACEKGGGLWETAFHLLQQMEKCGVWPSVITYNAAISTCAKGSQPAKALHLLNDMQTKGIKPTETTFNAAISACARDAFFFSKVEELLLEMDKLNIKRTVMTYTALASACKTAGKADRARAVLPEMRARGLLPNEYTYSAVISACENRAQVADLLQEMKSVGLHVDAVTLKAAETACSKEGSQHAPVVDIQ
jgi:pentatricopeptide repeat domain-containing protein 1